MVLNGLSRRARDAFLSIPLSVPSWATPWRSLPDEAGRDGARIAVIGNCQARGAALAMRLLRPEARVSYFSVGSLRRDHGDMDGLLARLAGFEHVFAQSFPAGLFPGGDVEVLRAREPRTRLFPTLVFSAFHPDMVYAGRTADLAALKLARSPLGHYHSAIALCAHRLGLDVARTAGLFREDVFRQLGYLDYWDPSVREMLDSAAAIGFRLEREMSRWSRRGVFMHVINHPKAFVVGDIARRLLAESDLPPEPVAVEDYIGDDLTRDVIWPVYPPIAELYGQEGSYLFKARMRGAAFPTLYRLEAFLAASFALYDAEDASLRACPRVDAWLSTPAIVETFRAAKRR